MKKVLLTAIVLSGFYTNANTTQVCVNKKVTQILKELKSVGAVLRPHHTDGLETECKVEACEKQYRIVSADRKAVGAVMTADIEQDIKTQCQIDVCVNDKEQQFLKDGREVGRVIRADDNEDFQKECVSELKSY